MHGIPPHAAILGSFVEPLFCVIEIASGGMDRGINFLLPLSVCHLPLLPCCELRYRRIGRSRRSSKVAGNFCSAKSCEDPLHFSLNGNDYVVMVSSLPAELEPLPREFVDYPQRQETDGLILAFLAVHVERQALYRFGVHCAASGIASTRYEGNRASPVGK